MKKYFLVLSILINLVGVIIFQGTQGTGDVAIRESWSQTLNREGVTQGYPLIDSDYPPLGLIIIASVNRLGDFLGVSHLQALKLLLAVANVLTGIILFRLTNNGTLAILTQLFLIPISLGLGYVDVLVFSPLIIGLHYLAKLQYFPAALALLISISIKWQPLIIAPAIFVYLIFHSKKILKIFKTYQFWVLLLAVIIIIAPQASELLQSLARATTHRALSANAANFYWLYTALSNGQGIYNRQVISTLIKTSYQEIFFKGIFLTVLAILIKQIWHYRRRKEILFTSSVMISFSYFLFNVGVHENHLIITAIIATLLAGRSKKWSMVSIALWVSTFLNTYLIYGLDGRGFQYRMILGFDLTITLAILNILLFSVIFKKTFYENE